MNYEEALELAKKFSYLAGTPFHHPRLLLDDQVDDLIVTPQDHPFFPEFLEFYRQSGSYAEASAKSHAIHGNEIFYAVKCVMGAAYGVENGHTMHVLLDLQMVLQAGKPCRAVAMISPTISTRISSQYPRNGRQVA